jgi:CGNR zinc finger
MRNRGKPTRRKIVRFSDWVPLKELVLAGERIGHTTVKRLKWLLSFIALDLDGLSQGKLSDLAWEAKAFVFPPEIPIQSIVTKHATDGYRTLLALIEAEPAERGAISLEKSQAFVRHAIESAFHGGWEFTYPRRTEKVGLISKEGEVTMLQFDITPATQAFEITVFDLIKAERERLGLCANERCRKPFVTEKKYKGRFCSPRCSAYVRVAKFRERAVKK